VVWVQGDGTDPDAGGDQLVLMGFDSEDGKGERVILSERRSRTMPRLTPRGNRIVFSSRIVPGPPEIFVVNWDGTGLRKLADGFAMALWRNPADGSDWVYAGTENKHTTSPR
jgi:Tol biopolymer transport system component